MNNDHEQAITVKEKKGQIPANAELSTSGRKSRPSNPTTQWKGVIFATIAAKRFYVKEKTEAAASEALSDHIQPLPPIIPPFNESIEENVQTHAESTSCDEKLKLEYLMVVHAALVQQLNSYGIVLTVMAAVTSVAVLQPPGSFNDEGHMRPYSLVACFLLFSSVSFLLACTGLMAVIVGSASLFRPWFFQKPPSSESEEIKNIVTGGTGRSDAVVYDDIPTLGEIILDNVLRVRRLRMYLALSLGLCMVAFVCGAFSILGPEKRNLYMAIGTIIGGGGLVLAVETGMTLAGPTHPPRWLRICVKFLSGSIGTLEVIEKNTSLNVRKTMTRTPTKLLPEDTEAAVSAVGGTVLRE